MKYKDNPLITDLVGIKTNKLDPRIMFFGTCDELSCHMMEVRCLIDDVELKKEIEKIVSNLSIIMGEVALGKCKLAEDQLIDLINLIKEYEVNNGVLTKFVLPGQTLISARIHITRCVARRTELAYAKVYDEFGGSDVIFEYLNKLSTLLFALAQKFE